MLYATQRSCSHVATVSSLREYDAQRARRPNHGPRRHPILADAALAAACGDTRAVGPQTSCRAVRHGPHNHVQPHVQWQCGTAHISHNHVQSSVFRASHPALLSRRTPYQYHANTLPAARLLNRQYNDNLYSRITLIINSIIIFFLLLAAARLHHYSGSQLGAHADGRFGRPAAFLLDLF